jgi:hypothetical protein
MSKCKITERDRLRYEAAYRRAKSQECGRVAAGGLAFLSFLSLIAFLLWMLLS